MCSLALVAWFSTMIAECGKLLSFTLGLCEIPRGKTLFHLEDGEIVLVRLARMLGEAKNDSVLFKWMLHSRIHIPRR
eukprot:g418.t1